MIVDHCTESGDEYMDHLGPQPPTRALWASFSFEMISAAVFCIVIIHVWQWHEATQNPLSDVYTPLVFIGHYRSTTLTTRFDFCLYAYWLFGVDYCTIIYTYIVLLDL